MVSKLILIGGIVAIVAIVPIFFLFPGFIEGLITGIFSSAVFWVAVIVITFLIVGPIGYFIYMWVPLENRAKAYNILYGKGHGVLRLKGKGRVVYKYIVSFNPKWVHVDKIGIFAYDDRYIYIEGGVPVVTYNELDGIEPVKDLGATGSLDQLPAEIRKIVEKDPGLKLYMNPVSLEKDHADKRTDPKLLDDLYMQFKATAEATTYSTLEDITKKYVIFVLAGFGIIAGGIFIIADNVLNQVIPKMDQIVANYEALKPVIESIRVAVVK